VLQNPIQYLISKTHFLSYSMIPLNDHTLIPATARGFEVYCRSITEAILDLPLKVWVFGTIGELVAFVKKRPVGLLMVCPDMIGTLMIDQLVYFR
jgi:hypothetical protein